MRNPKAVVLLSGGLDSTVALWWAQAQGYSSEAILFDYGQRHKKELHYARQVAHAAHVHYSIVRFRLPWSSSSLTNKKKKVPSHKLSAIGRHEIPSTYVPGRNTIFLSFALSFADQVNAQAIVIGANALDYSGYPDCRPKYLKSFEETARRGSRLGLGHKHPIRILAPLIKLSKAQIVRLGKKLGAPLHLTWSCYRGGRNPCATCDSCKLRAKGFLEAGFFDGIMK